MTARRVTAPLSLAPLEAAVWETIAYADMFDYPLMAGEIHRYLKGMAATLAEVEAVLHGRVLAHYLTHSPPFYLLAGREAIVPIRQQRAAHSQALWVAAVQYGQWVASLPFVRMVAVTGSLAVNNVDEWGDIDYLVVMEHGRVWLGRAFIIALVRFAAQRGHALCPNYILAETALVFPDQNLYTAHELLQMVPLYGLPIYQQIRQKNQWAAQFMPNAVNAPALPNPVPAPHRRTQKMLELPWRTPAGQWLDQWEMRRKIRKFSRHAAPTHEADFHKDWCKGHFDAHKQRVLQAYQEIIER